MNKTNTMILASILFFSGSAFALYDTQAECIRAGRTAQVQINQVHAELSRPGFNAGMAARILENIINNMAAMKASQTANMNIKLKRLAEQRQRSAELLRSQILGQGPMDVAGPPAPVAVPGDDDMEF